MKHTFKQEFALTDFEVIQKDIESYFKGKIFSTYHGNKSFTSYNEISGFLGLPYTSTGNYAGLWVTNTIIYVPGKPGFKIIGFALNIDNKSFAICNDDNEKEFIFQLSITDKLSVLQNCVVENNIIKLPPAQLDRKLYEEVKKSIELIGGKWKGGKTQGFIFNFDPSGLLEQIANGENKNLKKEYQFFETPLNLARQLVYYADLDKLNSKNNILEPSAGQGAIIKAILEKENIVYVDYCEIMEINQKFLSDIQGANYLTDDFLCLGNAYNNVYDRIIANPPFSKNQDIDHILKMYEVCKPGGRIVTIASNHWQLSNNKKESSFKKWLGILEADIINIEKGSFKDSGTLVGGVIIIIDK